jgi:hypothetical protein
MSINGGKKKLMALLTPDSPVTAPPAAEWKLEVDSEVTEKVDAPSPIPGLHAGLSSL